jgi:hypothetical protein
LGAFFARAGVLANSWLQKKIDLTLILEIGYKPRQGFSPRLAVRPRNKLLVASEIFGDG